MQFSSLWVRSRCVPPIPGVDGKNVVFAQDVYGNEDALAEKVVVIGGGEVGVETGMHLAEKGHKVTLLEMLDMLAPNAPPDALLQHVQGSVGEAAKPEVYCECTLHKYWSE